MIYLLITVAPIGGLLFECMRIKYEHARIIQHEEELAQIREKEIQKLIKSIGDRVIHHKPYLETEWTDDIEESITSLNQLP